MKSVQENEGEFHLPNAVQMKMKLLRLENELLLRQGEELRGELRDLKDKYDAIKKDKDDVYQEKIYPVEMLLENDGEIILEAQKFCETHQGCPFYKDCDSGGKSQCHGTWIYMGKPCPEFSAKINFLIRFLRERPGKSKAF